MQIILEVAIGLILTFAVIAVIVSSTMELIAAVLRMRARTLEMGVARLLDNERSEPTRFFGWLGFRKPVASTAATQVVLQHPLWATYAVPVALGWLVGIGGIFMGIFSLIQAFQGSGWGAGILGVLGIMFGLVILASPLASAVGLLWAAGFLGIGGGIALIIAAFRFK